MSAFKHTPGPWVVFHADEDGANDVLPAMRLGCIAGDIESAEDARLIAAAPDLLAALQEVMRWESSGFAPQSKALAAEMAYAAITKATGAA